MKKHTTVIFSTHILSDVERICDEIGLLHDGKLALKGNIEEIRKMRQGDGFEIEFAMRGEVERLREMLPGSCPLGRNQLFFPGGTKKDMSQAMQIMAVNHFYPQRVENERTDAGDIVYGGGREMRQLIEFTRKEFVELMRTGKIWILLIIFALFGIMNPAIAKLTPWMMEMFSDSLEETGMILKEIHVDALTSWAQFYKNISLCKTVHSVTAFICRKSAEWGCSAG